ARARRKVVTVRPYHWARIVRKQRAQELVPVVLAEWIRRRAHGVAHRVRPGGLWAKAAACAARTTGARRSARGAGRGRRWRRGRRRRNEQLRRATRLPGDTRGSRPDGASGFPLLGLIGTRRGPSEDRHHDQP